MPYIVVGLGNPGEEYQKTRHNTGRMVVSEYKNKKAKIIIPDTFMNNSGKALTMVKNPHNLIVVYDDFNLPLGTIRISYNRSSGGHNGLQSVIKSLKTEEFLRVRIGISPKKLPEDIENFILGEFKEPELKILKKSIKKAREAMDMIILEGKEKAMSLFNAG